MSAKTVGQTKMTNVSAPSVSQQTRGKRKLDFDRDLYAFAGKTLFFDLPGYKHTDKLEYEVTQRGGAVVKFFQRGVKYLVTNRPRNEKKSSQSPSTPSPHTPGTNGSKGVSQVLSPAVESPTSGGSGGKVKPQKIDPHSRAAKIMAASKLKQGGKKSVDILEMAKSWNCKVVTLTELLKELKRLKPLPKREETSSRVGKGKVRKLKAPFVKVEDQSKHYRPIFMEMKEWPRPNPVCSPKHTPYDTPRMTKHQAEYGLRDRAARPAQPGPSAPPPPPPAVREKRDGYCECCTSKFMDLNMHLRSAKHQEYASNSANFASLDKLISQGKSFSEFIASVKARRGKNGRQSVTPKTPSKDAQPDIVVLVTPPSPPRKPSTPLKASPKRAQRSSPRKQTPVKPPTSPKLSISKSPRKRITLTASSFTSPKQGELRIRPVVEATKLTTPPQIGRKRLRSTSEDGDTPTSKKSRRNGMCLGSPKKTNLSDLVPETPEKGARDVQSSPLLNLANILNRVRTISKVINDPTKTPPPGNILADLHALLSGENSNIRRSPRLREKEMEKLLTVKTEDVKSFIPPGSNTLTVSIDLSKVFLKRKPQALQATSTPCITRCVSVGDTITPEISLQGVLPVARQQAPLLVNESPLFGVRCPQCRVQFDSSSSDGGTFLGFSPNTIQQSFPDFATKSSPSKRRPTLEEIASKLMQNKVTERKMIGRKRERKSESPLHSSPVAKRRRVNSESPRRSIRLLPSGRGARRRSPEN